MICLQNCIFDILDTTKPDLNVIAAASKFAEVDSVKSGIVMFENWRLGVDEAIKDDDEAK